MKYTASFQVVPIQAKNLTEVIDRIVEVINSSGLNYEVNAHSTIVEGEKSDLLNLLEKVVEECEKISERCVVSFQIDLKKGGVSIDDKVSRYRMGS
ncbi:MAG: thiamine-binding protein [Thermotogaceae bacterium]|nr:thiamine-binding protein [Thermotogaceae bacterium]